MIQWLSKENFNQIALENLKGEFLLKEFCFFNIKQAIIEKVISAEPETVLEPEPFSGLGPYLNWFGKCSNLFFILTFYLSTSNSSSDCLVSIVIQDTKEMNWRLLNKIKFPSEIIENITWISGIEKADYSVYSNDENNLFFEIYRAENENNANDLRRYLLENGFKKKLFVKESEKLGIDWVVEKEGKCIARYTSRYTAEHFALRKSETEESVFTVFSPDISNSPQFQFEKGKKQIL